MEGPKYVYKIYLKNIFIKYVYKVCIYNIFIKYVYKIYL